MHYGARAVEMLDTAVVRVTAVNECCCLHFHVKGRNKRKHPKCLYKATNLLTGKRCQPTVTLLSQHQAQHLVEAAVHVFVDLQACLGTSDVWQAHYCLPNTPCPSLLPNDQGCTCIQ